MELISCSYCGNKFEKRHKPLTAINHISTITETEHFPEQQFCRIHCMKHFIKDFKKFHDIDIDVETYVVYNKANYMIFEAILSKDSNSITFEITQQSPIFISYSASIRFCGNRIVSSIDAEHAFTTKPNEGGNVTVISSSKPVELVWGDEPTIYIIGNTTSLTFDRIEAQDANKQFKAFDHILKTFTKTVSTQLKDK